MLPLTGILIGLVILGLALAVAAFVVPGIDCDGLVALVFATVAYMALSWGIGMVVALFPMAALAPAGMIVGFLLAVVVLWIVGQIVPGYEVDGFGSALFGAIIVSLAQFAASALFMVGSLARMSHPA